MLTPLDLLDLKNPSINQSIITALQGSFPPVVISIDFHLTFISPSVVDDSHELWKEGMALLVGLKLGHIMGLTLVNEMCVEIAPAHPSGSFKDPQVPLPSVTRPAMTLTEAASQPRVPTPEPKLIQNGHDVSEK